MMTVESKIGKILRPAEEIYSLLSDFTKIAPLIPKEHINNFHATQDSCTFEIEKYGSMEIRIVNREPFALIKYSGGENTPMQFNFWIQLKEVVWGDSRIKLTLKAEVPKVMQFMIKGKIEKALNDLVDKISSMHPTETNLNYN
jgi:carbon monoxide dehydrogenase subunit G